MKSVSALTALLVAFSLLLGVGCTGQPFLSDQLGLLPGPATDLLQQAAASGQLSTALQSGGFSLSDLSSLAGSAGDLTGDQTGDGTDTTGDDTGDQTQQQDCPEGQVWVGTVEVNGQTMAINGCIDESLARQYGVL